MSVRLFVASLAVGVLVLVVAAVTDLSLERAILLAPVLVIGVAAVAGLAVFWTRAAAASFRRTRD